MKSKLLKSFFILLFILIIILYSLQKLFELSINHENYDKIMTYLSLEMIAKGIDLFKQENNRYPSRKELVFFLYEDKNKQYVENNLPPDYWGNDLIYKTENNQFILYSIGRNKLDNQGQCDDITFTNNNIYTYKMNEMLKNTNKSDCLK